MRAIFFASLLGGALCALCPQYAAAQGTEAAASTTEGDSAQRRDLTVPNQDKAREIAEMVYNTWRLSLIRGNEQAWRSSTGSARQMELRNLMVSQRKRFPADFFRQAQEMPQLENFRYVGTLCGCGNRSMAVTYIGKMQLGERGHAATNAYVLEFVNEGGKWKLDQTRFFNLSQMASTRKRLEARDLSVLKEQDGFHPYEKLPQTPRACGTPQLIGKVFVDCPGREIEMSINGVSVHSFDDERRADVISGGLHRGDNSITYRIRTENGKKHPAMAIGLFVMPETPGNKPVCVFDHILDAKDRADGGNFIFTVSNEQIASMNPKFSGSAPQPFHAVPLKEKKDK